MKKAELSKAQMAFIDFVSERIEHAMKMHGTEVNCVLLPSTLWENCGKPKRVRQCRVLPFDDACKEPQVWVGVVPEGADV